MGSVLEGKVTGITKFGAFVSLTSGRTGMVHISEIAHTYVNDIKDHLKEGQDVTVKIIGIDNVGRINLSIKKAIETNVPVSAPPGGVALRAPKHQNSRRHTSPENLTFEDKLKQFMQDSENKMSDLKHNSDKRGSSFKRGRK